MSRRTERLNSTIRQELAQIMMREIDDPRIKMLPAITKVETADDLSVADVYVSIMGTPGQQTAALNALKHSAGMMRTRLAKMLTIRQMPFLRFQIDEGHKKEIEMLELLHKLEVERQEKEAAATAAAAAAAAGTATASQAPAQEPGNAPAASTATNNNDQPPTGE